MRVILMGPPGSGKGTQAGTLAERLTAPHGVDRRPLLREHVRVASELGMLARGYTDRGDYVPDHVTSETGRHRLSQHDARDGFVVDGYPRTEVQVETLDAFLGERQTALNCVIELVVEGDELVHRLAVRARAEGRTDDVETIVRRRQEIYHAETAPLLDIYRSRDALIRVNGTGTVNDVRPRIDHAIESASS